MVIQSLHLKPEELEAHNMHLEEKYQSMREELPKYQIKNCKDAEIVFVAFGTMSRIVNEAIDHLKAEGITAGLIRPITLWPFPEAAFDEIDPSTKVVISTELAIGQMMEDVKSAVAGRFPVDLIYRTGGMVPTPMEVARRAKQILEAIR
jgi:2-oxoglutarate ferredoxin oxidoreductase subunit alpha